MRARNLGALVTNLDASSRGGCSHGRGGGSGSTQPAAAEVILHFELFEHGIDTSGNGGSAEAGGASGAPTEPAAPPSQQQHPTGRLLVRRRVMRSGRSDLAIQRLPASSGGTEGHIGSGAAAADGGGSGKGHWRAVSPAALHDLLAPYGIQTEAVDR